MKEQKRTTDDGQPIPNKIPAADVVKLVTQNVFQLG
jgi:hypothetical protein